MVAPIRDLGNITTRTLLTCETTLNMTESNDVDIGVDLFNWLFQSTNDFYDEVRGYSLAQSAQSSSVIAWTYGQTLGLGLGQS